MTDYTCFPAIERQVGRRVAPAARRVGGQRSALQGREVHSDPCFLCPRMGSVNLTLLLAVITRAIEPIALLQEELHWKDCFDLQPQLR